MAISHTAPILVAVDFSACSEAALVWAAQTARRFDTGLIVLHVVHDPGSNPGYYATHFAKGSTKKQLRRMEEAASEMLSEFLKKCKKDYPHLTALVDARPALVVGIPAARIVEVATRDEAQLIVVGSRGRTGLSRLLLGSKAQRVAMLSPIPVTIVKDPDES